MKLMEYREKEICPEALGKLFTEANDSNSPSFDSILRIQHI